MKFRPDRRAIAAAGIAVVLLLCLGLAGYVRSIRADNASLRAKQKELAVLKDEALKLKAAVEASEARSTVTKVEGVVQAVDEIVKSLGVSQKVKSVKPTGTRDRQYAVEEEAEVQLEKLSMNEMVNLFFRIENAPMALAVKKATVKTSFENPALMNVSCTVSLIKQQGQNQLQAK